MYTIDLGNGTILENLDLNGNNFVSKEELTEEVFDGMEIVTITNNETDTVEQLHNVILVALSRYPEGWYFVLREMTEQEVKESARDAQVLFTAIATDTLIEEV